MAESPIRRRIAGAGAPQGGAGFSRYSAGRKHYGMGRPMPNVGGVSNASARAGYTERDARRDALMQRAFGR